MRGLFGRPCTVDDPPTYIWEKQQEEDEDWP